MPAPIPNPKLFLEPLENLRLIYRTWRACRKIERNAVFSETQLAIAFYRELAGLFEAQAAKDDYDESAETQPIEPLLPITLPPATMPPLRER